jgi:stage V sporulation protein D (sporulation-specific penicillin-binding protein)
MENPQYIVLVALDTPSRQTGIYISGGVMAAPTVGAVMSDILPYPGVTRQEEPEMISMPDLLGLTLKEAQKQLKSLGLEQLSLGGSEIITGQIPAAGEMIPKGSQVLLYLGEDPDETLITVPDFSGMTRQQASDAAGKLGLYILPAGNTDISPRIIATYQSIAPGMKVPVGTTITIKFTDTDIRD